MKRKAKELEEPPASRGMKRKAEELEEPPASPDAESPVPQADMEARLSEFGAEMREEFQDELSAQAFAFQVKLSGQDFAHRVKHSAQVDEHRVKLSAQADAFQAKLSAKDAKLEASEKKHKTTKQKLSTREDQLRAVTDELGSLKEALADREIMNRLEMLVVIDIAANKLQPPLSRNDLETSQIRSLADLRHEKSYKGPGMRNYLTPQQIALFWELKKHGNTVAHSLHGMSGNRLRQTKTQDGVKEGIFQRVLALQKAHRIPLSETPLRY
eukprot:m.112486 g.112486  ORF g.112486 m.112486 type:complete len:270 (+) comp14371_c0_seq2:134-943(+)